MNNKKQISGDEAYELAMSLMADCKTKNDLHFVMHAFNEEFLDKGVFWTTRQALTVFITREILTENLLWDVEGLKNEQ